MDNLNKIKEKLEYLKGKGKKTTVIAPKDRLSNNLRKAANVTINLTAIKDSIKK